MSAAETLGRKDNRAWGVFGVFLKLFQLKPLMQMDYLRNKMAAASSFAIISYPMRPS
jgi:hypothetical protein